MEKGVSPVYMFLSSAYIENFCLVKTLDALSWNGGNIGQKILDGPIREDGEKNPRPRLMNELWMMVKEATE